MINILKNRQDPVTIGDLEVEVTLSEDHDYKNDVTRYPVEEGFDISDHIHQQPESVTLSGVFSDTPLPIRNGTLNEFIKGAGENRTQKAVEELLKIAGYVLPKQNKNTGLVERQIDFSSTTTSEKKIKPQTVDIVSGIRVYTNMICSSLKIRRDRRTGYSLPFSMSFTKFYTVESEIVILDKTSDLGGKAPNIKNKAPSTKEVGVQSTKTPKSQFATIWDSLRSTWGGK